MSGVARDFEQFVVAEQSRLLRLAWMLTGDWYRAQDLLQSALLKAWRRWPHLSEHDRRPEYVRRIMTTTYISATRRQWIRELPLGILIDKERPAANEDADERLVVARALATLPPRQRAVVALRFFEDLTELQTAAELGCAVGTVKSQTSKALRKLRNDASLFNLVAEEVST